jgi:hypothetical protein
MTEITRETLELAALAAGLSVAVGYVPAHDDLTAIVPESGEEWRPHLDDGDAMRLAVAVGMNITAPKYRGDGASAEPLAGRSASVTVYRKDSAEQMRLAIVLCAAAVGERMRGER